MYYEICRNASGYLDPTAAVALLRIIQEENTVRREAENMAKKKCRLVQRKPSGVLYVSGTRLAW